MPNDARQTVTSKERRMATWANIRTIGKWRYIYTFGMTSFGSTLTLLVFLQDIYFGRPLVWPDALIKAVIYVIFSGGLFGYLMWALSERAYAKYVESKLERF